MAHSQIPKPYPSKPFFATLGDVGDIATMKFTTDGTTAKDLTGYTFEAQCRPSTGATAMFPIAVDNSAPTTGIIGLSIDLTAATESDVTAGEWVWDIVETDPDGNVRTFAGGPFYLSANVTVGS